MRKVEPIFWICRRDYAHRQQNVLNSAAGKMKEPVNALTQQQLLALAWQYKLLNEAYLKYSVKDLAPQLFPTVEHVLKCNRLSVLQAKSYWMSRGSNERLEVEGTSWVTLSNETATWNNPQRSAEL